MPVFAMMSLVAVRGCCAHSVMQEWVSSISLVSIHLDQHVGRACISTMTANVCPKKRSNGHTSDGYLSKDTIGHFTNGLQWRSTILHGRKQSATCLEVSADVHLHL